MQLNILDLIVDTAYAQAASDINAQTSGGFGSLVPLIIIFFIFYFLLIRPQQKKIKEHQEMTKALKKNDKVVTAGGIIGTISKVNSDNETIEVKIANGVEVTVLKSTVTEVMTRAVSEGEESSEKKKK